MELVFWLVLMLILLLIEAATVGLVSLWFAAGSLVALISAMLGAPLWLQVVLFVLVSGVLLAALRPLTRKLLAPRIIRTNADSVIGSTGLVTDTVDNIAATGQVKLGPMYWTARSTTGAPIAPGTMIRVDRIEGVKVYVTAAPQAEDPQIQN